MDNFVREDYLSLILNNINTVGEIKPGIIASKLSVTNAAVSDMLRKLAKDGFIFYKPYKSIQLTLEGRAYAYRILRRHSLWELYLNTFMGIPLNEAHLEANMLEHLSSDSLINRIEEVLGYPKLDLNGNPIPNKNGEIVKLKKDIPLYRLNEGECGRVLSVNHLDENFLCYIDKIGIVPKEIIKVKEKRGVDKSMAIIIRNQELNITSTIAENVFVERELK